MRLGDDVITNEVGGPIFVNADLIAAGFTLCGGKNPAYSPT